MRNWFAPALAGIALLCGSALAQAQAPSKAQQDALRSNCRSDFMRYCSSVRPGGPEALQCLMSNKAKVSAGCQGALNAIAGPAPAAKPEPKAAAPAPAPAPAAAAPAPAPAPSAAPAAPQSQPTPAAAAPAAPAAPAAKKPAKPAKAAAPAQPAAPAPVPPAAAAPAAAPAPAPAAVTPPPAAAGQPRLGEAILVRRFCALDAKILCGGVPIGQGRIIQCLANNAGALRPMCRQALMRASAQP